MDMTKAKYKVGIIGCGMVGGALRRYFEKKPNYEVALYLYDKKGIGSMEEVDKADFIYVCLPTPYVPNKGCDTSIVEEAISKLSDGKTIIIKSTVIPKTTEMLAKKFPNHKILFSPEFLTEETADNDMSFPDRQIIGYTTPESYKVCRDVLQQLPIAPYERIVPARVAEFVKYGTNTWFSVKVAKNNELYDLCKKLGLSEEEWEDVVSGMAADKRVGRTHLTINHKGKRGYWGKCLLENTLMYANNYVKKSKDVKVGDYVLTIDGSWRKVLRKFDRITNDKKENLFIIKGQGMEEFGLTGEHPVLAVKSNRYFYGENKKKLSNYRKDSYELEWIDAEDLEKGDFVALPRIKEKGDFSLSHFSDDLMRLFGYFTAEGNIEKGKNRISIAFNVSEKKYIKDVIDIVKNEFGIKVIINDLKCNCSVIRFTDRRVCNLLKQHCGEMADKKVLSNEVMTSNNISEFLKGYFRGDGSKSTGIYSMSTISEKLYYQLKLILLRFGIGFTVNIKKAKVDKNKVNHKKVFTIRIRNYTEIKKFNDLIGDKIEKDLKLFRKTSWFDEKFLYFPIKEIKKVDYTGKVYNFEVEGNQTFVVVDAIVHNCLPKDMKALLELSKEMGVSMPVSEATDKYNDKLLDSQGYKKYV